MAEIISAEAPNKNPLKKYWNRFRGLDKFSQLAIVGMLLVMIATPIITKNSFDSRQRADEPITAPIVPPSAPQISWATSDVSLQADEFSIIVNGITHGLNTADVILHSDPENGTVPDNTTLEAIWHEQGVEMRLFLYFQLDVTGLWKIYEVRTYNGSLPGEWVYYTPTDQSGNGVQHYLGQTYQNEQLLFTEKPAGNNNGQILFRNIRIQAFLPHGAITPTSVPPTITPTPVQQNQSNNSNNNNNNNSNNSNTHQTCQSETPHEAPRLFQISTSSNKAILSISPVSGNVSGYAVAYGYKPNSLGFGANFSAGKSNGAINLPIMNLAPNKTYYFAVRALNGCTAGPNSITLKATTTSKNGKARVTTAWEQARSVVKSWMR